jgi:hypothetical protein
MVLSGIQETNYPVSSAELRMIQRRYYTLIHPEEAAAGGDSSSDSETEEEQHERDPENMADMK